MVRVLAYACVGTNTAPNALIFDNQAASLNECKAVFRKEFALLLHRAKQKYFPDIVLWLDAMI